MKKTILLSAIVVAFLCPAGLQAKIAYKVIDLGTLGGDSSQALSINNASQIVGWASSSQAWERAALFDPTGAGKNIDLGTLAGYQESQAHSINDAGQIIGWAEIRWGGWRRATLFDPTGAGDNVDLGTLGGGPSLARCINDAGQIVGWAEMRSWPWGPAILFDPTGAGNNIQLGGAGSAAYSINDAGQIVGWAESSQGGRATLFDPAGARNNIDLNTRIDPASGWTLVSADDINASGWIVGMGINPQGQEHAFLLVPKPPCLYRLAGDLNDDCRVDFADLAVMAANWLVDCGAVPTNPACIPK